MKLLESLCPSCSKENRVHASSLIELSFAQLHELSQLHSQYWYWRKNSNLFYYYNAETKEKKMLKTPQTQNKLKIKLLLKHLPLTSAKKGT